VPPCTQARFQGVPDWINYCGRDDRAKHLQIGNAVPYLLAVEVTASVFKAATGQDGRRPPALVGPSLDGVGVPAADLTRYMKWVQPAHISEAGGLDVLTCTCAALGGVWLPLGSE
jgi:hypothetical protein